MKRFIFIALIFASTISASFAQIKSEKSIGIDAGLGVSFIDGTGVLDFQIQPQFNYFVANNCQLSIGIGYGFSNYTHTFLVNPGFNYYVKLADGLYYTPGINIAGGITAIEGYSMPTFGVDLELFSLEFRPTSKLGITFHACNFTYVGLLGDYITINGINFGINTGSTLGLKFYF